MVIERWLQIKRLFDAAHDQEAGERARFLDQACGPDLELRREVESLLACEDSAAGFLESEEIGAAAVPKAAEPAPEGERIGPYTILEQLGAGGMGLVYKAYDNRLERQVAVKFLARAITGDPAAQQRFEREARSASALNHPNICTVHDVGEFQGRSFIVMELLEGQPLKERLAGQPVPLGEFASVSSQVCAALAAAHAKGIVHRDVNPANIFLTRSGQVKILDFGLAKRGFEPNGVSGSAGGSTAPTSGATLTASGTIMGTLAYMSPEQVLDENVDERSDIFSLGVVLYEMAAGRLPFRGKTAAGILGAILTEEPPKPSAIDPAIPDRLERVILKALEKDREDRYQSVASLAGELDEWQRSEAGAARWRVLRNPRFAAPLLLVLAAVLAVGIRSTIRSRRAHWARNAALPEIARLVNKEDFDPAFRLARRAESYLAGDPEFSRLRSHFQIVQPIHTEPPGADVYVKGYLNVDASWVYLGKSPIQSAQFPNRNTRWKATKEGHEPAEAAIVSYIGLDHPGFKLRRIGAAPPGMVGIPGGGVQVRGLPEVQLKEYWLDKYEVTNRQFQEFVDRGGYRDRRYWKHAFVKDGRVLSWEEAMAKFCDRTGQQGPSTWVFGHYPVGQEDFPVSGVSWYEAAAYAEFTGKRLPTFYHWTAAVGKPSYADIVRLSNFSGKGPAPVGSHQGLSRYGNYDMGGNVREWCWNEAGGTSQERRYILGGSWNDQSYMLYSNDAAPPFDRSSLNGFRCARYEAPLTGVLQLPLKELSRDYSKERPVNDAVFQAYRSFYSYDRTGLKAAVEAVDDTPSHWRRETVTLAAAYDNQRIIAHLFLPKNSVPPYQTVVYFPCAASLAAKSSDDLELMIVEFLVRSGRAVLYPVYYGMYERHSGPAVGGPASARDRTIRWAKDFGRSVDYLETRSDIDRDRLAFYGLSLGAVEGPILTAIDGRMKAVILHGGGLPQYKRLAEADPIHFAPRVRAAVLMIGGRLDFIQPVETYQRPLLRLLGAPGMKDKQIVIVDRGHSVYPIPPVISESLAWLDRYLGRVKTRL
ncbi:MAG: protein kinase [Bryobacterales bacterium]|nr:protein kinase [Bryobacterales bacterium]